MKKIFSSALFLGLALGIGSTTFAQDNNSQNTAPNAQEKMGRKNRLGKMRDGKRGDRKGMAGGLNRLNLTDAQKQQLQNLRQNNQTNNASRAELRQLIQAQRSGTLTTAQQTRLNALKDQIKANAEKMREQVSAILTPEQRRQFDQMKQGRKDDVESKRGENRSTRREGVRDGDNRRFQGLNLTDSQKEQLRNLRTNNSNDASRQELRELRQAKQNGSLTTEQQNRLKILRQQARANGENRKQQILSILTPEQRQQLEQNRATRKNNRNQKMQNDKDK